MLTGRCLLQVSAHPPVRAALLQLQRDFAAQPPADFNGEALSAHCTCYASLAPLTNSSEGSGL